MIGRIVVNGWFWGQLATGSGQYLHALAQHLPQDETSAEVVLVLPRARFATGVAGGSGPSSAWQTVVVATPFDRIDENVAKLWFEQVAFPRACRSVGADLAFVPYWGSPAWRPCRTAVTVHDLIPLILPAYHGGILQRLYTRLVSWTARHADVVLTDSQASRADIIRRLRVPDDRVQAVLLAAGQQYQPIKDQEALQRVRRRYNLPGWFLLYLGGFDVRKNVPHLLRAYAGFLREQAHDEACPHLVIAGKPPAQDTAFTPDPRPVAAALGIDEWVHFTGWVDEADKPALYSLASLFVFPSLYEGFGLPVAEAAACGVQVLTSSRSSLPEIDTSAILVDPSDEAALAQGIAQGIRAQRTTARDPVRTWSEVAVQTYRAWQVGQ